MVESSFNLLANKSYSSVQVTEPSVPRRRWTIREISSRDLRRNADRARKRAEIFLACAHPPVVIPRKCFVAANAKTRCAVSSRLLSLLVRA